MRIKNWDRFQHFKDRKPIWIKLYRDLLDDLNWHELDGKSAKALVMIWLIASEDLGKLPETKTLAFRLRMSEKETKEVVTKLSQWLEQDDINPISDEYQDDMPEKRREETDKEKEKETDTPSGVSQQVWDSFVKQRKASRAVITDSVIKTIKTEADKAGWTLEQALSECAARGWRGFKAEWVMPKPNPADRVRLTVAPSNEPDPALLKIKADALKAAPIPLEVLAKMAELRRKA